MADVEMRFFCHQCSRNIPRVAADYTCPTCHSGFIEELGQGAGAPSGQADHDHEEHQEQPQLQYDLGQVLGPLESILPGLLGGGLGQQRAGVHLGPGSGTHGPMFTASRGPSNIRISARAGPGQQPGNLGIDQAALENALQDFVFNLAGMQFGGAPGGGGGGARFQFIGPGAGQGAGFQLHGNPGDYAWGRGGLDTIITQLLNQMDGAGPPPMASDTISAIPTVTIDKKVLEKNASCSVCFEDFSEGEQARLLECGHCFHTGCIVPWLELHGTCPVCRKVLDPNAVPPPEQRETEQTQPSDNTNSSSTNASSSTSSSVPPTVTTPTGGGGLSGMIHSAISQVFRGSNWASTSQPQSEAAGSAPSSSTGNLPQSPDNTGSNSSRDNNGANRSDDDTPVARRQRLDSDFVDFDFD